MSSILEDLNHVAGSIEGTCEKKSELKFYVEFRRHDNYKGEYGFDWMHPEYDGTSLDFKQLKTEYTKSTKEPRPSFNLSDTQLEGETYFVPWLSLFPLQTVELTLKIFLLEGTITPEDIILLSKPEDSILFLRPEISLESEFLKFKGEDIKNIRKKIRKEAEEEGKENLKKEIKDQKELIKIIEIAIDYNDLKKKTAAYKYFDITLYEANYRENAVKAKEELLKDFKKKLEEYEEHPATELQIEQEIQRRIKEKLTTKIKLTATCVDPLNKDTLITAYNERNNAPVGYLKVLKNSDHEDFRFNITPIRILRSKKEEQDKEIIGKTVFGGFDSDGKLQKLEDYLNKKSLNQALLQCSFKVPPEINTIDTLVETKKEESSEKIKPRIFDIVIDEAQWIQDKKIVTEDGLLVFDNCGIRDFRKELSRQLPQVDKHRGTFLFLAPLKYKKERSIGAYSNLFVIDAKTSVIFKTNLWNFPTFPHEIAHVLGLEHIFLEKKRYENIKKRNDSIAKDSAIVKKFEKMDKEINRLKSEKSKCKFPDIDELKKYAALEKEQEVIYNKIISGKIKSEHDYDRYKEIEAEKSKMNPIFELDNDIEREERLWKIEDDQVSRDRGYHSDTIHRKNYFEGWNPHKFKYSKTENMMDYDNKKVSFYKFQWLAMQNDVKKYYSKK